MGVLAHQLALGAVAPEADHDDATGLDSDHRPLTELRVGDLLTKPELGHVGVGLARTDAHRRATGAGRLPSRPTRQAVSEATHPARTRLLAICQVQRDLGEEAARD